MSQHTLDMLARAQSSKRKSLIRANGAMRTTFQIKSLVSSPQINDPRRKPTVQVNYGHPEQMWPLAIVKSRYSAADEGF